jgi:hypothetical protein
MKNFSKFFYLILSLSLLSACSTPNWYKPYGYFMFKQMPKNGTPGFKLGWLHGCESGLSTQFAGAFYMTFYSWKKDPDIASVDPNIDKIRKRYPKELKNVNWKSTAEVKKNFSDYNTIFWNAHAFCRHSALGLLYTADMAPPLPGEERYNMMAHSVGNVFKITARDTRVGSGANW